MNVGLRLFDLFARLITRGSEDGFTFYVHVYGYQGATGSYSLTVN